MLRIIHCDECGNEGSLPFILEWEYSYKWCQKCGSNLGKEKRYYFCSDKCLKKFVNKFVGHKHKWVIIEMCAMYQDDKITKIKKTCEICNIQRGFKATKADIKQYKMTMQDYFPKKTQKKVKR